MKKLRNAICFMLIGFALLASISIAETVSALPKIYVNNVPVVFLDKEGTVINPVIVDDELYVPLTAILDTLMIDYSVDTEKIDISTNAQPNSESELEKIVITSENFEEYFDVKRTSKVTYSERESSVSFGSKMYDVEGEYTVTVTAKFPCEIYDLAFSITGKLEHLNESGEATYDEKTLSFTMPQSGICEEKIYEDWVVGFNPYSIANMSSDELERNLKYMMFYNRIISVKSGYIILKNN